MWNRSLCCITLALLTAWGCNRRATNETETIACTGVFVFIGLTPNAELLDASIGRDDRGFLQITGGVETTMPGVLAIGAVRAGYGGRLTNAVSDATVAAELAVRRCNGD